MKVAVKARPEDFVVEERLRVQPGGAGDYAVYRVTKRLLTTPEVQQRLADQLGVPPRAIVFPALKDKRAVATQHCTIRGRWPSSVSGDGYAAQFVGRLSRHLSPADLLGNRFMVVLRGLAPEEAQALALRYEELAHHGLPNYFDQQRFGSYASGQVSIGKAVLKGDAEGALKAYLAQPMPNDPPELRTFKAFARDHWRDWPKLFERAPRSNQRSVLTFLKDHPGDLRKALNLITPRLLPLFLATYQSALWNRIASALLARRISAPGAPPATLNIAGGRLVVYLKLPPALTGELRDFAIPLPHHRAAFASEEMQEVVAQVLAAEGLALTDLKARLLKRAYLPRGERPLLLFPEEASTRIEAGNHPDERLLRLAFFLRPGSYATLVVKVLVLTTADA